MALSGITSDSSVAGTYPGQQGQMPKKDGSAASGKGLTPEEQKKVSELQATDAKVRAHEQAHVAAGGQYVRGGVSYEYEKGPDGKRYAVGGEVSIDTSAVKGNPDATISKMEVVIRAALAPADPSGQDRSVAAQATSVETQARMEKSSGKTEGGKQAAGKTDEKTAANAAEKTEGKTTGKTAESPTGNIMGKQEQDAGAVDRKIGFSGSNPKTAGYSKQGSIISQGVDLSRLMNLTV